ncbi:SDR family NAD(P)-dependent oxidoreductase [Pedobacter sp. KR3-3]|uniref:SDR family NAD(P)-dependent oxidoreductase n=1 Tax=Pedobacter albus TaxID=3113905 RepID=A0ABU7I9Q6_9SPHI|nr:SDR family NAD(P)-dependent oxidoreductase [Pedobacter sp. KR3-3]MEE1946212.1 SDR family NAD(P)-dependent oxidoreductase [Pedobacter sp. KR3-3]
MSAKNQFSINGYSTAVNALPLVTMIKPNPLHSQQETISILGCGWYGLALSKALLAEGYRVKGSTTSENKLKLLEEAGIASYLINFDGPTLPDHQDFFTSDVLFISIPPKRNLPQPEDYLRKMEAIKLAAEKSQVQQVVFISSTGVFEDGNFIVDETVNPQPDSPAGKALLGAEELFKNSLAFTTTIIRFGGLFGPNRNLAKHFAGRKAIANGLAPINLIHLDDCIQISLELIKQKAFGHIYHGVSPFHPSRAEFYTQACLVNGLESPEFLSEKTAWKQIESIKLPAQLNYVFKVADWEQWTAKMAD